MKSVRGLSLIVMMLAGVSASDFAMAQNFPSGPITLVLGTAPGGILDTAARIYADVVSRSIRQPVIVDTRPAGGGVTAAAGVASSKPDGYTILMFPGSQMATVPAMQPVPYDPLKAFAPITLLFSSAALLTVPAGSPVRSVDELWAYARNKDGGLLFGLQGVAVPTHLLAARIAAEIKVPLVFVQYRGAAPMMSDLLTARLDAAFPSYPAASGFFAEQKLRALAVDADRRIPVMPDVPTLQEVGIKDKVASWFAIAAPAGTPSEVIGRLNAEFVKASRDPDLVRKLEANGILITTSSPEAMGRFMLEESIAMTKLVQELGLQQK